MITSPAFAGKRYAVLGLARSGLASVESLVASGAEVMAWDNREEAREAEDGVMLSCEGRAGDHLSFSVDRPARARMKLMIQKRITTVGSDQPRCSKWWWIGAIRKTRLPVRL